MQPELLIALLAGLGGMFGWGLADFFAKKTIDKIGDIASLAWGHIFGTAVLLGIAIYQEKALEQIIFIPQDSLIWLGLIFFGVLQAIVYLLVYKGFGKGQVGVLSPIFASFAGLTAILSIAVFGEAVSQYAVFGLAILFVGILLINVDLSALRSRRFKITHVPGIKEVGIATLLAAIWTLSWDKFVGGQDWLSYALFMYAFMTVAILVFAALRKINLFIVPGSVWKFLALIGICETIAYAAISFGYSQTSLTSIISLLSGAFSLPTIVLAHLFLKEKITAIQTVGSIVIVVGIMILSYYN